ncbi:MAG: ribosome biogenesis GTPase YlqF [Clostridia bacterium]|nr:ribosome biogenesis GTPase YlqF [Clostridia bacterium]
MKKALREMEEMASFVDCFVYILDSRIPSSSINPEYEKVLSRKPNLYVLNKSDLVNPNDLTQWIDYFNTKGKCIQYNSKDKNHKQAVVQAIKELNAEKIERYKNKGITKNIRCMVIGVPNSGKSSFINSLSTKNKAITQNRPGVTRNQQWVPINDSITLLDTPGTLFPDFSNQQKALNLATVGSVKEIVVDEYEISDNIMRILLNNGYEDVLYTKYNFTSKPEYDFELYINTIAENKNLYKKGGELDFDRASNMVIQDFRRQGFGKIMLEKFNNK